MKGQDLKKSKITFRQIQLQLVDLLAKYREALLAAIAADFGRMPFEGDETEFDAVRKLLKRPFRNTLDPSEFAAPQLVVVPDFFPLYFTFEPVIALLSRNIPAFVQLDARLPNLKNVLAECFQALGMPDHLNLLSAASNTRDWSAIYTGYSEGRAIQVAQWKEQLWSPPIGIVDETANLEYLATRLTWRRFFGKGTTHLEPQMLFVQVATRSKLLALLQKKVAEFQEKGLSVQVEKIEYEAWSERWQAEEKRIWLGSKDNPLCPYVVTCQEAPDWLFAQRIPDFVLPIISFKSIREILRKLEEHPPAVAWHLYSRYKPHVFTIMRQDFAGAFGLNEYEPSFLQRFIPFGSRHAHSLADRPRVFF